MGLRQSTGEIPPQPALSWNVEAEVGSHLVVRLSGEINENADFSELKRRLCGHVELVLDGITRINSCGVREWLNFLRELTGVRTLRFSSCSPPVVTQLNSIYNFRGPARVSSFLAPFVCETCRRDEYKLLDVEEHFPDRARPQLPRFRCERCGGDLVFDDLPERYLSFLSEPASEPGTGS